MDYIIVYILLLFIYVYLILFEYFFDALNIVFLILHP
jgi:hypothetical protein